MLRQLAGRWLATLLARSGAPLKAVKRSVRSPQGSPWAENALHQLLRQDCEPLTRVATSQRFTSKLAPMSLWCGTDGKIYKPSRKRQMSLGWITFGTILCLFSMIALMPRFDGKWE